MVSYDSLITQWTHIFTYLSLDREIVPSNVSASPWLLELASLPPHPSIAFGDRVNADVYLCISKPTIHPCPPPPEPLIPWIHSAYDDPAIDPIFTEQILMDGVPARFNDAGMRPIAEEWLRARNLWRQSEQNAKAVLRLYDELFSVYSRLKRGEPYELFVGDARVCQADLDQPMLLHAMTLSFDATAQRFWLRPIGAPIFDTRGLYLATNLDRSMLPSLRCEYDASPISPLDGKATALFLRRLSVSLRAPIAVSSSIDDEVFLQQSPVLFMRPRATGIERLYQQILWRLRTSTPLPKALMAFSGVAEEPPAGFSTFAMPATLEQRRVGIGPGATLIEGVPGTGKTYTLANAVFLAVAEGKRVLLTAPDQESLDAFCAHLPPAIRALCLGYGGESGIENAIDVLLERADRSDLLALEEEAKAAERQYGLQETAYQRARSAYQAALELESRPIECLGHTFTPYEAANFLRTHQKDSWIPGPIRVSTLPISADELEELYHPIEAPMEKVVDDELSRILTDLPSPDLFDDWARQIDQPAGVWWDERIMPDENALNNLYALLKSHVEGVEGWEAAILESNLTGNGLEHWQQLYSEFQMFLEDCRSAMGILEHNAVNVPQGVLEDETSCRNLFELIEAGKKGKISRLALMQHSAWKPILAGITVGERAPQTPEDWDAVEARAFQYQQMEKLSPLWGTLMVANGAPPLPQAARSAAYLAACCERMGERIGFRDRVWLPITERFAQLGLNLSGMVEANTLPQSAYAHVDRISAVVEHLLPETIRARFHGVSEEVYNRFQALALYIEPVKELKIMYNAVLAHDAGLYRDEMTRLSARGKGDGARGTRRGQLLEMLASVAPNWAASIQKGIPAQGNVEDAWLFCQLQAELQQRLTPNLQAQQQVMEEAQARLVHVTGKMYEAQAWLNAARWLTPQRRMQLLAWKDATRRAHAAQGMRARALMETANGLLAQCAMAAPVWALPLPMVLEAFTEDAHFDVIALDEAGSVNLDALALACMCDTFLMAGDEGQMEWGTSDESGKAYAAEFLSDVPHMEMIEGGASLFEYAQATVNRVALRSQFRSLPDIAQCVTAAGDMQSVRDASRVKRVPQTVVLRADAALGDAPEAQTIAALVKAMTEMPEYVGASIGVAALYQTDVLVLERILRQHVDEGKIRKHKMVFSSPQGFRGIERDVMFVWIGQGDGREMAPKLRAAVSRARDQLWIVHDLDKRQLPKDDPRGQLIERAQMPRFTASADVDPMTMFLKERLVQKGFDVIPYSGQGAELFLRDGGGALIACEGGRFRGAHRLSERIDAQSTLARMGWRLLRLSGAQVGLHPKEVVEAVAKKLMEWGVQPGQGGRNYGKMVEEILSMAEKHIANWRTGEMPEAPAPAALPAGAPSPTVMQ